MGYFDRGRGTLPTDTTEAKTAKPKPGTCTHIKTNGERCEAFALKNNVFCYYHFRSRQRAMIVQRAHTRRMERLSQGKCASEYYKSLYSNEVFDETSASLLMSLELPELEDTNSLQITVGAVIRALIAQQIDRKTAALVLYGCQITSGIINKLRNKLRTEPSSFRPSAERDTEPLRELRKMLAEMREAKMQAASHPAPATETAHDAAKIQEEPNAEIA